MMGIQTLQQFLHISESITYVLIVVALVAFLWFYSTLSAREEKD